MSWQTVVQQLCKNDEESYGISASIGLLEDTLLSFTDALR